MSDTETRRFQLASDIIINVIISRPLQSNRITQSPVIIFLHFWGGSHQTWSHVNPIISCHYTTVAIDFRGWGESVGPARADAYSISHLADDVEAIIDALAIPSAVVIVGLSMGAKTAQLVAGRGTLRSLAGLVLISPAPPTPLVLPPDMQDQQLHAYDNASSARFVAENVLTATTRSRRMTSP
jgi:pimeloyl-ACP methyl ester carboxylesterase